MYSYCTVYVSNSKTKLQETVKWLETSFGNYDNQNVASEMLRNLDK